MLENNDKYFINKGVSEYKILSEISDFLENNLPSIRYRKEIGGRF